MEPVAAAPLWFSRQALQAVDQRAETEYGLCVQVLMENAGRNLAEVTRAYCHAGSRILVLAGGGNNGGDGLVAARHLANIGHPVEVILLTPGQQIVGSPAGQLHTIRRMAMVVHETAAMNHLESWLEKSHVDDAIIDAIFGTGLKRPVTGDIAHAIARVNDSGRRVISADIPSGLDCDTGQPLGIAVRAAHTVSFCGMKIGFAKAAAIGYVGQCSIGDIGVPRRLLEELAVDATGLSD